MGEEKLLKAEYGNSLDKTRMGIGSWRPDWLQHFNSMKWYLVALSLASLTQGIFYLYIKIFTPEETR